MGSFFNIDGPIWGLLNNIANVILLNLLWILCCIPVVTVVPATTAMYYVTLKMVKKEEPYILRSFFYSFRENFKQGLVLSVIFLTLGYILCVDIQVLQRFSTDFHQVLLTISYVICALTIMTAAYVCPLLSRFQNTVVATIKNAIIIGLSNPLKTVIILTIDLLPVLLLVFFPDSFAASILFWVLFGFATLALVNSILLSKLFARYESKALAEECSGIDQSKE